MATILHVLLIFSAIKISAGKEVGTCKKHMERNTNMCKMFARKPFFEPDLVVGTPWRIYYTWKGNVEAKCIDMYFKNATKEIVHRVWSDMNEYLEMQPNWEAAALLMAIGSSRREVMLFTDQGPAGSFIGVPNIIRDGNIPPLRKTVSLIKFHMKLLANGKYLVVMDCQMGVASLSSRSNNDAPTRTDIMAVVKDLDLGEGYPACVVRWDNENPFPVNKD